MTFRDFEALAPSRQMGVCCWCRRYQAMTDVRLGLGNLLFFDGDLCCFCLADFFERYPEDDEYLAALVKAKVPAEIIRDLMQRRFVRNPPRYEA